MKGSIDLEVLEEIVDDIVTTSGFDLVEMKLVGTPRRFILKVYIHNRQGVGVDDCAKVSRELGTVLDERDLFPSKYVLEVSSPGAERIIGRRDEFELFRGREIKIDLGDETCKRQEIIGTIKELRDDELRLDVTGQGEVSIPLKRIRKARLHVDWNRIAKRSPDEF
ncbi:MAG: ribosome maturation factor RimP [Candidatus Glassbacteria bacterium]